MNYPFFVFIFLLGFFVSCSNTPEKVSKKQDNSISAIDTVRFLAVNDSIFVRVSDKDTIGYAIDVLNRFSEEVGVPYRLILCSNTADVINKFSNGYGNLFLASTLHDSIANISPWIASIMSGGGDSVNPEMLINIDAGAIILFQLIVSYFVRKLEKKQRIKSDQKPSLVTMDALAVRYSLRLLFSSYICYLPAFSMSYLSKSRMNPRHRNCSNRINPHKGKTSSPLTTFPLNKHSRMHE